jgi:hypothetical protein
MRIGMRSVPWCLAVAGLGLPLAAGGFAGWPYAVLWSLMLIVAWFATRNQPSDRRDRIILPAVLAPVLFVLGFLGGWYLIPADIAWLLIELADRRRDTSSLRSTTAS